MELLFMKTFAQFFIRLECNLTNTCQNRSVWDQSVAENRKLTFYDLYSLFISFMVFELT
jgi:hypothetical protein